MNLNRELDRALGGAWGTSRFFAPALDVVETADGYTIAVELPGVDPSQVEIAFERNTLTLRGTKQPAMQPADGAEYRVYTAERVHGPFERAIRLPEYVDGDRIEARAAHGVLTITVPKSEAAKPRRIEIR
jgi:HSP20 family protein